MRQLPERVAHLEKLPVEPLDWTPIHEAVRPECRGNYIDKARRAAEAGLWDAAVLYFWNESMNDLRRKVVSYGVEFFPNPSSKRLTNEESLREHFNDFELIEGCYQLGIISKEAWFFLQQCREVRNHYTVAHESDSQIDAMEAQNFIKNCVKYALAHDLPAPGFSIKDFVSRLREDSVLGHEEEVKQAVLDQNDEIRKALLHRLFQEYTTVESPTLLRSNIEKIVPHVWNAVTEEAQRDVGYSYIRVRLGPSPDAALLALNFFRRVNGVGAIPDTYRATIFEGYANALLDAHRGPANFSKEGAPAAALNELGYAVPESAAPTYVKAILLSFVGNGYGHCWKAEAPNTAMLQQFGIEQVKALIGLLETDRELIAALTSPKGVERFRKALEIVASRPLLPAHEKALAFYREAPTSKIIGQMRESLSLDDQAI